jgi:hypothetical protein
MNHIKLTLFGVLEWLDGLSPRELRLLGLLVIVLFWGPLLAWWLM